MAKFYGTDNAISHDAYYVLCISHFGNICTLRIITIITSLLLELFSLILLPLNQLCYPHRSVFKFRTAVLPVLRLMFQAPLPFVVNLLNSFSVRLPNFSLKLLLELLWLQLLPV